MDNILEFLAGSRRVRVSPSLLNGLDLSSHDHRLELVFEADFGGKHFNMEPRKSLALLVLGIPVGLFGLEVCVFWLEHFNPVLLVLSACLSESGNVVEVVEDLLVQGDRLESCCSGSFAIGFKL